MKAASTYTAAVLARYLGTSVPAVEYDWLAEQNYTDGLRRQLGTGPFVLSLHMRPHRSNLAALSADGVGVTLLWRNLGDVIPSYDDHVFRYGAHNPMFFVDHSTFVRLPRQERFRHAIDGFVPWNIGFYLHWRGLPGLVFNPYELLITDRIAYFTQVISQLGIAVELEWLARILSEPVDGGGRMNVGASGRSSDLLDPVSRRRVERYLLEHPQSDEVEVLLWELPWTPLELARLTPWDGSVISADHERHYFVSRGIRCEVSLRWMASRALSQLRTPRPVEAPALAALPTGGALD